MASKSFVSFNMVTFEQGFVCNKNKPNLKSVLFRLQSDVKSYMSRLQVSISLRRVLIFRDNLWDIV